MQIVRETHEGFSNSKQAASMASHVGINATRCTISNRFYWPTISKDVSDFVRTCNVCQCSSNKILKSATTELHNIPIPTEVFKQVGIDIAQLPESSDGYKYVVVLIDYFSKWTEARALKDKTANSIASFLFDCICRHGCMKIQINDQGREFVNEISSDLHQLCGTEQRITSAYHPQSNGLVERQNQTIKKSMLKVSYRKSPYTRNTY